MAATMCYYCETRRAASPKLLDTPICQPCYDYQGDENAHNDEGHAEGDVTNNPDCLICQGADDPETTPPVKGHSNGIKKSHTSHAGCEHESTKSARAKCRKERAQSGE